MQIRMLLKPHADQARCWDILLELQGVLDAEKFVNECKRVLRHGGKVLVATANKDLYDFNPSPHSCKYYGVMELNELFARHGFEEEIGPQITQITQI